MSRASAGARAVVFTDDPGWHGRVLREGLAAHGVETRMVSLTDCGFGLDGDDPRLVIPGFEERLPDGAFVRGVPGGTLEQVILRLNVLHALSQLGVPVFNTGRAIERTVDKGLTTFLLKAQGIATPRTWVTERREAAREIAAAEFAAGRRLVLKPLFGSQGEGLQLLADLAAFDAAEPVAGVWYLQAFVERGGPPYRDFRVLVVDGIARYAMSRTSAHWVTNRAQGAACAPVDLDPALHEIAERAAAAVDVDYAGVDLFLDADGQWSVGEVNGVPAWWGLQQACGHGVTDCLVAAFVARVAAARR